MTDNGGASYGGVSFASLGLLVTGVNLPLLPETIQEEESLPGLDGSLDMEMRYGPRMIEVTVELLTKDESEYQAALQRLAKVFNARLGSKPLVLDRMPGKRWMAKYNGTISIEKIASLGSFTLPFKAFYPFSESVLESHQMLEYGQNYLFGMGLRYGDTYSFGVTTSPKSQLIYHAGTHEAFPVIRMRGSGSNIKITNTATSESLTINTVMTANDVVEINCAPLEQTILKNGISAVSGATGKFPRLIEGENKITISATGANLTVDFIFRHTYLY
ncbi:phage tail family protein [Paenibacillus sp. 1011MAR3C5]|uniref:distal tail protein Dit n=1 Tax=Paenibacillus sp. 1011MAR3C5 TaxID=1675787 RepID=UPI000E6CF4E1|nr:distal tail protein Dit [Paenibacillus sp. 1011MAR3C5]RJE90671.1 phage tail family protein [Paenibacillus sp. 1011MAR3C5]